MRADAHAERQEDLMSAIRYVQKVRAVAISVTVLAAGIVLFGTGALSAPAAQAAAGSNVLYPGETLWAGQSLYSTNGWFKFSMQADGNFVLYTSANKWLWQSGTAGRSGQRVVMQTDGNLVIYTASNYPLWWSGTNGYQTKGLVIQNDGNAVISRSSDNYSLWYTHTAGQFVQCWHVYHNLTIKYGGWASMGTVHIAADVCGNGDHVWLEYGGSTPQCWTDNGITGTAWVTWCGITWIGNWMQIGANMTTHATAGAIVPINVDSHDWIRDIVFPDSQFDAGPTGGDDVWWGTWSMN